MKGETIFITGGAGYLGLELIKRLYKDNTITIFSRNGANHEKIKTQFPKVACIVGDVQNLPLLTESLRGHTVAIFAGSPKRVDEVDKNPKEASHNIIDGALNAREASIANKLKAAIFISTDKSRMPTTLYGAMKFVAGEAFIMHAEQEHTKLNTVICGNIINSTGSVIPLMWNAINTKTTLTLFGEEMTRYMMDPDEVLSSIIEGTRVTGYDIVPLLKAHKVKDLFEIYAEEFGLRWKLGDPRPAEKTHEQMLSPYELGRTFFDAEKNMYFVHYKNVSPTPINTATLKTSSEQCLLSKNELKEFLKKNNYFRP